MFDFTDPSNPKEIAFFDRGPMDSTKLYLSGFWAGYWYNGLIYGSEIGRGLDIFELKPSEFLSQNEIDAAKLIHVDLLNVQNQQRYAFPPTRVPRAYWINWRGTTVWPPIGSRPRATRAKPSRRRRGPKRRLTPAQAGRRRQVGARRGQGPHAAAAVRDWQTPNARSPLG